MKIMNQLTFRYLKENKKRTILTILCITVSVIMICCVGIAFYSGKQFYKEYIEKTVGDYHYLIVSQNPELIKKVAQDKTISEYYFSHTEPYYRDDQLTDQSFLNLKRGDELYFQKEDYGNLLVSGRLPQNTEEIVISQNYLKLNQLNVSIGDSIDLYNNESHTNDHFQIVGLINDYNSQNHYKNSFNAISYIDFRNAQTYYTLYIKDKELSKQIFDHAKNLSDNNSGDLRYNSSYLAIQDIFEDHSSSMFLGIYNIVGVLLAVIIIISLFIIYQAFNLSTNDRIQYLGMLSSVGATPKQKKRSVYFEGLILSCISIPLGIILSFLGLLITFHFINLLETVKVLNIAIYPQISGFYLFLVIIISLITIFISLYLPARKISKISVIDALKKNDEITVKPKKLKTGLLARRFLNVSQQLAIKNYKRQGRRSRVIVMSLVISMVSFISMYSFSRIFLEQVNQSNVYNQYDIQMNMGYDKDSLQKTIDILNQNQKVDDYYYMTSLNITANIDSSYLDIPIESDKKAYIQLIGLSENKRQQLCDDNHITYQKNLVLAYDGKYKCFESEQEYIQRYKKMDKNFFKSMQMTDNEFNERGDIIGEKVIPLQLFDQVVSIEKDQFQNGYGFGNLDSTLYFIVPIEYITNVNVDYGHDITYNIFSSEHQELTKELESLNYTVYDYAQNVLENRQIFLIIQIFVYGFVCIMILFTMLNIINMMSASIDKRKKELGMMLSVGMSPKGITKMLFYESFIYGLKTLLYGLPICIGIEWLFYDQISSSEMIFIPSFLAYMISFVVIIFVMLVTFRVGLNQFKKQNIIETLKDDM